MEGIVYYKSERGKFELYNYIKIVKIRSYLKIT